jgi:hypothetical protein
MYTIGKKVWRMGEEVTITTTPYQKHGGWWQDGQQEDGKVVTLSTPEQVERRVTEQKAQWKAEQVAFSRLRR